MTAVSCRKLLGRLDIGVMVPVVAGDRSLNRDAKTVVGQTMGRKIAPRRKAPAKWRAGLYAGVGDPLFGAANPRGL